MSGEDERMWCDRCSAEARVRLLYTGIASRPLMPDDWLHLELCGHHFAEHEARLLGDGWEVIVDWRGRLVVGP